MIIVSINCVYDRIIRPLKDLFIIGHDKSALPLFPTVTALFVYGKFSSDTLFTLNFAVRGRLIGEALDQNDTLISKKGSETRERFYSFGEFLLLVKFKNTSKRRQYIKQE